jgi:hypothetical protein
MYESASYEWHISEPDRIYLTPEERIRHRTDNMKRGEDIDILASSPGELFQSNAVHLMSQRLQLNHNGDTFC